MALQKLILVWSYSWQTRAIFMHSCHMVREGEQVVTSPEARHDWKLSSFPYFIYTKQWPWTRSQQCHTAWIQHHHVYGCYTVAIWPLAALCWPEFSLGLPQIHWHPGVMGSVERPSSTLTELSSTRDSWTLCAEPAPASAPRHCQTGASRKYTHTHTQATAGRLGGRNNNKQYTLERLKAEFWSNIYNIKYNKNTKCKA